MPVEEMFVEELLFDTTEVEEKDAVVSFMYSYLRLGRPKACHSYTYFDAPLGNLVQGNYFNLKRGFFLTRWQFDEAKQGETASSGETRNRLPLERKRPV